MGAMVGNNIPYYYVACYDLGSFGTLSSYTEERARGCMNCKNILILTALTVIFTSLFDNVILAVVLAYAMLFIYDVLKKGW